MEALIRTGLAQLGQAGHVPPNAPALLARYGEMLLEKNQVMNLTAITQPQDVATLHMLDCATLLDCARFEGKTLIDVGTGAEVTLLDSLNKRLDWLDQVGQALGLEGLETIHARAEEAGRHPALRERFDFAAARAVADLRLLCELCLPFVKVGGRFLAMKGPDCGGEIQDALHAIHLLGGEIAGQLDYAIPHTQVTHRVIVVHKVTHSPEKYPRRWAKMQKSPLQPGPPPGN